VPVQVIAPLLCLPAIYPRLDVYPLRMKRMILGLSGLLLLTGCGGSSNDGETDAEAGMKLAIYTNCIQVESQFYLLNGPFADPKQQNTRTYPSASDYAADKCAQYLP
jgi:hypothetical protein